MFILNENYMCRILTNGLEILKDNPQSVDYLSTCSSIQRHSICLAYTAAPNS